MLLSPEVIHARCNSSSSCDTLCPTNCDVAVCNTCDTLESCDSCSGDDDCSACCITPIRTFLHLRSQGANTARELVGWQWEINKPFMCAQYGSIYLAYEFQRSFKGSHLANGLFGGSSLGFAGSAVQNRTNSELLADNFGLAQDFRGRINFCPRIENHIFDFGYFVGLDCWLQGAYLRMHAPIVHSKWSLRASESDCTQSTTPYPTCYVDSTSGTTTPVASSIEEALSGSFLFGDMRTPLCSNRVNFCRKGKSGLADIDLILGYNYFNTDCYHLGAYLMMVLPTGPLVNSNRLFAPQIGNNRHFELGVGFSAHSVLFGSECHNLALFFEGNITHMFKNTQCRTFDFANSGSFSRYLLLKEFDTTTTPVYAGNLISATCFNTRKVHVKINVKGDASVKLAYRWGGLGIDVGYNIYGHGSEKIRFIEDCCIDQQRYAIKGTENVCAFAYPVVCSGGTVPTIFPNGSLVAPGGIIPVGSTVCSAGSTPICSAEAPAFTGTYTVTNVPDNSSQPNATAFSGSAVVPTSSACTILLTQPAVTTAVPVSSIPTTAGLTVISTTPPTRFVSSGDLNIRSAEAYAVLTHKAFGFINYTWFDNCGVNPNIGIGASVEVDGGPKESVICKKAGLSQWGILVKGGFSF